MKHLTLPVPKVESRTRLKWGKTALKQLENVFNFLDSPTVLREGGECVVIMMDPLPLEVSLDTPLYPRAYWVP